MDATGFLGVRPFTWLLIHQGIILLSLVGNAVLQSCSETQALSENSTFSSPGYPSNYLSLTRCSWNITVPEGTVAIVQFQNFRIESCSSCGCDYVQIFDGPSTTSPLLAKLCGSSIPQRIYATQNKMFIEFTADGSVTYGGFTAQVYKAELLIENIESDNGTIQSPNYPNNYQSGMRFLWNITVPENNQIFLEFVNFELQYTPDCTKDFVQIRDGIYLTDRSLGKFCGTNVERYLRSSGNRILISFQTDDSTEAKGFVLQFRKVEPCGTSIEASSGNVNSPNYPNNYGPVERCLWKIRVPPDHHILFRFLTINISDTPSCAKDFVQIHNGNDTTATSLGKFCGSDLPNVTKSTSNEITVVFWSDASDEAKGFSARFDADFCGEEFNSDTGTFHSPNYPNAYGIHEMCTWKVTVSEGYRVALRFDAFELESHYQCNADSITVFDGLNATNQQIDKICGTKNSKIKVYSTGNTLSVRMVTDHSYSKSGFTASYTKVPIVASSEATEPPVPCVQEITSDSGTISSPRYPEWYSRNINCVWKIEVPQGKIVRVEFQSFDVEDDKYCSFDYVFIFDGSPESHVNSYKFCGTSLPESKWSTSNKMALQFVSDSSFENPGFSATFTKVDYDEKNIVGDSGTLNSPNYPANYGPAQMRLWKIEVPIGHKIYLKFLSFDLQYSQNCTDDFVEIYDSEGISSSSVGRFCGSASPSDIRSSSRYLTVVFATDTSEETKGFSAKFEKEEDCGGESCRNGGTCSRVARGVAQCSCKHGYEGILCDQKTICDDYTCEHGGLCFQNGTDGVFQCVCSHGYEGAVCHERILCGNETCKNEGYCTHEGPKGIFKCVCGPGYEGLLCERLVQKRSDATVAIVVPLVILVVIASAVILFLLVRKRLKRQVTQPYDDMKQDETFFDKDEMLDS